MFLVYYRIAHHVWQAKGPSAIMERVQRGDLSLQTAALALGVNPAHLGSYMVEGGDKGTPHTYNTIL